MSIYQSKFNASDVMRIIENEDPEVLPWGPVIQTTSRERYSLDIHFGWITIEGLYYSQWHLASAYPVIGWEKIKKEIRGKYDKLTTNTARK